jgi:putative FmdB family regulatory protein
VGHPGVANLERLIDPARVARPERACHHAAPVPTYDYQCRNCGHTTEVIHSMLEDGPSACERCGGALRRVIHPTGIIFRGSGFYKTDSRSSGSDSTAGTPAKAGAKGADGTGAATGSQSGSSGGAGGDSSGSSPSSPSSGSTAPPSPKASEGS